MVSLDRFLSVAALLVAVGLGGVVWKSSIGHQRVAVFLDGPSSPSNLVFDRVWHDQVDHNDDPPIDCAHPEASSVSQCFVSISIPEAAGGPAFAILEVKAKAWIPSGPPSGIMNYGLIYASFMFPNGATNNHLIHVEAWGGQPDYEEERRRVTYSTVIAPIIDGKVLLRVGKQIMGRAEVEIAGYIEGYLY